MTKHLTFGFALLILAIIAVADLGWNPSAWPILQSHPHWDKLGHFLLMGVMAFLLNRYLDNAGWQIGRWRVLHGSVILLVLVTAEELTQIAIPSRSFSWGDLAADVLGIVLIGTLARWRWPAAVNE